MEQLGLRRGIARFSARGTAPSAAVLSAVLLSALVVMVASPRPPKGKAGSAFDGDFSFIDCHMRALSAFACSSCTRAISLSSFSMPLNVTFFALDGPSS